MRTDDARALSRAFHKCIGHRSGTVVDRHTEAVVGHIQHQVLAHNGQADKGDVCLGHPRFSLITHVALGMGRPRSVVCVTAPGQTVAAPCHVRLSIR